MDEKLKKYQNKGLAEGENQWKNCWLGINDDPEIFVGIRGKDQVIFYDGYYSQYIIYCLDDVVEQLKNGDTKFSIGFDGSLWYNFTERDELRLIEYIKWFENTTNTLLCGVPHPFLMRGKNNG